MWLTSTAQHAIRAVAYLAEHADDGPVAVDAVAAALGAPRNYLSKTLHVLVNSGVLRSTRGPHGGFQLAASPGTLTLARVVEPFADVASRRCLLGRATCGSRDPCALHSQWAAASERMHDFFRDTTVGDLLAGGRRDPRRAVVRDRRRSRSADHR